MLDVNSLNKSGYLRPGFRRTLQWVGQGGQAASVGLHVGSSLLVLRYRVQSCWDDDWQDIEQPVPLRWTSCRFGGQRPWFVCLGEVNGRACARRVIKLYLEGRYFLCRQCHNISYASQSQPRFERLLHRANKRRMALGGEPGVMSPIADKPKGMHWRTYWRLVEEIENAEMNAWLAFVP